jgi:hypothetical protein
VQRNMLEQVLNHVRHPVEQPAVSAGDGEGG